MLSEFAPKSLLTVCVTFTLDCSDNDMLGDITLRTCFCPFDPILRMLLLELMIILLFWVDFLYPTLLGGSRLLTFDLLCFLVFLEAALLILKLLAKFCLNLIFTDSLLAPIIFI